MKKRITISGRKPLSIVEMAAALIHKDKPDRTIDDEDICPQCNGTGICEADKYEDGEIVGKASFECRECGGSGVKKECFL